MTDSLPDVVPAEDDEGPVEMLLYMRDQSALVVGWRIMSGPRVVARGVVSEPPTSRCIIVPGDWTLGFWRVRDIMDRPDLLDLAGPAMTSGDVIADGDLTLAIDVDVTGHPATTVGRIPEWWRGPQADCP